MKHGEIKQLVLSHALHKCTHIRRPLNAQVPQNIRWVGKLLHPSQVLSEPLELKREKEEAWKRAKPCI